MNHKKLLLFKINQEIKKFVSQILPKAITEDLKKCDAKQEFESLEAIIKLSDDISVQAKIARFLNKGLDILWEHKQTAPTSALRWKNTTLVRGSCWSYADLFEDSNKFFQVMFLKYRGMLLPGRKIP